MEVLRPFVNILLFVVFFWFFGRNSLEKYLKGDVIISRNTDRMVDNIQPGMNSQQPKPNHFITISPILAAIILVADVIEGYNVEDCVKLMEFEEFEMCLRNKGHSLEDILISTNGQMNSTYRMTSYGPEHVLKLAQGQIKSSLITIKEV